MQETKARFAPIPAGTIVQVRSEDEILATLDARGTVDGLPFMPEMRKYCGRRFSVLSRAHKTCIEGVGMGKFKDVVFLEDLRCDGSAHAGCGRGCLLFWKECWLRSESSADDFTKKKAKEHISFSRLEELASSRDPFFCQSTQLTVASRPLPPWDTGQYLQDMRCHSISYTQFVKGILILVYNRIASIVGFTDWGTVRGSALKTQSASLNLQPGETVRVRPWKEIQRTLDRNGKNRGLRFTRDMIQFCGKTYRVSSRLDHMILEKTGIMKEVRDTVILEDGVCNGVSRRLCPRRAYFYWREIWLERA